MEGVNAKGVRGAKKEKGTREGTLVIKTELFVYAHRFLGNRVMSTVNTSTNQKLARAFTHG